MPLIAVTTGEVSCGGWLGVRVVGRLFAAFVDPDRPDAGFFDAVDRLPADRADPEPAPRVEARPDAAAGRGAPDREPARGVAEVFPGMRPRYPLLSHQPHPPHRLSAGSVPSGTEFEHVGQCAASWVCCLAGVIFRHTQLAGTCLS